MKDYGLTHEQLAYVAVAQRRWAAKNPRAMYRDPITVDDVLASRMVAYPFHLLECCLVTDGGGALIVTSADRAADFPKPAVHLLGAGESSETPLISQMKDFTESQAFRLAGRDAFAQAGITTADVGHLMIYDAFAHVPIYGLEALGFTAKGEAGPFIADGNTEPGGVAAAEHERRRPVLHPHRHVRDVRDPGGGAPGQGRGRGSGRPGRHQRRARQRRHVRDRRLPRARPPASLTPPADGPPLTALAGAYSPTRATPSTVTMPPGILGRTDVT